MTDTGDKGFSIHCIHAGESLDVQGSSHMPPYNHLTFTFEQHRETALMWLKAATLTA